MREPARGRRLLRHLPRRRALIFVLGIGLFALIAGGRVHRESSTPREVASTGAPAAREIEAAAAEAREPTRISGTVTASDGRGVRSARVCASSVSAEPGADVPVCTDTLASGQYVLVALAPGGYWITAEAERYFPGVAESGRVVAIAAGEVKTGLDIALELGGAKVAGRVLDATGGPIAGATVRAMRTAPPHHAIAVVSGPGGLFSLWVLPGAVTLSAEAIG